MTLRLIEGWDHLGSHAGPTAKGWIRLGNSTTNPTAAAGRISGSCIHFFSDGSGIRTGGYRTVFPSATNYPNFVLGFAINIQSPPQGSSAAQNLVALYTSGSVFVCGLRFNSATNYYYVVDAAGSTIITFSRPAVIGAWHYIEIGGFCNGASGTLEARMEGANVGGPTTCNIGSTGVNIMDFSVVNDSSNTRPQYQLDDVYFVDRAAGSAPGNTFLGDVRIETIFPTAEGNSSDWTPLSGADNALMVDDPGPVDSDTTYVSSNTVGSKDTYVTGDVTVSSGTVFAVQTCITARKDDALTRQIKHVIPQGGVDYDGSVTHTISSGYLTYTELMELDPAGGAWSVTDVNSDEFGMKLVT